MDKIQILFQATFTFLAVSFVAHTTAGWLLLLTLSLVCLAIALGFCISDLNREEEEEEREEFKQELLETLEKAQERYKPTKTKKKRGRPKGSKNKPKFRKVNKKINYGVKKVQKRRRR